MTVPVLHKFMAKKIEEDENNDMFLVSIALIGSYTSRCPAHASLAASVGFLLTVLGANDDMSEGRHNDPACCWSQTRRRCTYREKHRSTAITCMRAFVIAQILIFDICS